MQNSWYTSKLKPYAPELRKNMTKEERKLWSGYLRSFPMQVKRQKIIGGYIADFYIPACRTVIELDGSQHYSDEGMEYDRQRNEYMQSAGITVLRYSNSDVNNHFSSVCEDIRQKCLPAHNR